MNYFLKIVILLSLFFYATILFGQTQKDRVAELRIAFISKKLELSQSESQKFWPIYSEYTDKVRAIRKNLRKGYKKGIDNLSDKEVEELYLLDIKSKQAETNLHTEYAAKIKEIIGTKKCVKLRVAEEEFKQEIIQNIKEKSD